MNSNHASSSTCVNINIETYIYHSWIPIDKKYWLYIDKPSFGFKVFTMCKNCINVCVYFCFTLKLISFYTRWNNLAQSYTCMSKITHLHFWYIKNHIHAQHWLIPHFLFHVHVSQKYPHPMEKHLHDKQGPPTPFFQSQKKN